jgi:di/tricarboxylate transporter
VPKLIAFIDESKSGIYILAASIVDVSKVPGIRRSMRLIIPAGQNRIHFRKDRDILKDRLLKVVKKSGILTLVATSRSGSERLSRDECLAKLVPALLALGVTELIMELDEASEAADRRTITALVAGRKPTFQFRHETSTHEPCLWIPDAVAWCYQRGGEWRQKVAYTLLT